jgi:hypothetical protein
VVGTTRPQCGRSPCRPAFRPPNTGSRDRSSRERQARWRTSSGHGGRTPTRRDCVVRTPTGRRMGRRWWAFRSGTRASRVTLGGHPKRRRVDARRWPRTSLMSGRRSTTAASSPGRCGSCSGPSGCHACPGGDDPGRTPPALTGWRITTSAAGCGRDRSTPKLTCELDPCHPLQRFMTRFAVGAEHRPDARHAAGDVAQIAQVAAHAEHRGHDHDRCIGVGHTQPTPSGARARSTTPVVDARSRSGPVRRRSPAQGARAERQGSGREFRPRTTARRFTVIPYTAAVVGRSNRWLSVAARWVSSAQPWRPVRVRTKPEPCANRPTSGSP